MIVEEPIRPAGINFSTRLLLSGSGSPVLLLHGSPDTADEWRGVMNELGPDWWCIAPDLPGLGASDKPPATFDYSRPAIARFLDGLLESLEVKESIVLVMHDIGGIFGIPWAAGHLDRIRGVVITNTVVFERFPWFGTAKLWARTDAIGRSAAFLSMWQLGWLRGRIFRAAFKRISPELPEADVDRMTRTFACDPKSKRSTLRLFREMVPEAYFTGMDAMVADLISHVPVRVVWGRGDPYIPARYSDRFPGATLEIDDNAGHWVPISVPARVANAVKAVIASSVVSAGA